MHDAPTSCFIRPYYERDTLYHWEVLLDPVQIRPGYTVSTAVGIFDGEHQARDFVRGLKAEHPELVELAAIPSACPLTSSQEAKP
ncbi:hypothetical protein [Comamonas terrae]|uniref:Uncharacterized protein n=1 Tax=Comamonas terrae TaxID=673548 RepID=A0ABW5UP95_9BURK|nr:hypothetical protein [Comamonas terrae]